MRQARLHPLALAVAWALAAILGGVETVAADDVDPWSKRMENIHGQLVEGRWQSGHRDATELIVEMTATIEGGPNANKVFGLAVMLLAASEAGLGDAQSAEWHWHLARSLHEGLPTSLLAELGDAGLFLERLTLRKPGETFDGPNGQDGTRPPLALDVSRPVYPQSVVQRTFRTHGSSDLEVLIDPEGRPRAPLVRGEGLPDAIFYGLEAVRGWRFVPAERDGVPVASVVRLRNLQLRDSLSFALADNTVTQPLNALVVTGRHDDAIAQADRLLETLESCAVEASSERCRAFADTPETRERTAAPLRDGRRPATLIGSVLALRAVARAGRGDVTAARVDANLAYNVYPRLLVTGPFRSGEPHFALGELGEITEVLEQDRPRCWPQASSADACDALPSDAWPPNLQPPTALETPRIRLTDALRAALGPDRLIARFVVDIEGRVREPRMVTGHATMVGLRALEHLASWRFTPATLDGEPVAVVLDAAVPTAPATTESHVAALTARVSTLATALEGPEAADRRDEAHALVDELAATLDGDAVDLLAEAVMLLAVAEERAGDPATARWQWHVARELAPQLRHHDLARFGAAGENLAATEPSTDLDDARAPVRVRSATEPRFVGDMTVLDRAEIAVEVGPDGRPRAPRILAGRHTGRLFHALDAVRGWRFDSGETVPVRHRVQVPLWRPTQGLMAFPPTEAPRLLAERALEVDDDSLAQCLWNAATHLEPSLMTLDLSKYGSRLERLRAEGTMPPPRWSELSRAKWPRHVDDEITPPVPSVTPKPRYTNTPRKQRVQGVVITQSTVDREGRVRSVKILRQLHPELDVAAAEAICQWQFEPATLDGEPIEVYYNATTNFSLR